MMFASVNAFFLFLFYYSGEGSSLWKSEEARAAPLPLTPARLLDGSPESASCSIALGLAQALHTKSMEKTTPFNKPLIGIDHDHGHRKPIKTRENY